MKIIFYLCMQALHYCLKFLIILIYKLINFLNKILYLKSTMNYLNSSNGISFCVLKNNDLNVI